MLTVKMEVEPVEIVTGQLAENASLSVVLPWLMMIVGAALVVGVLLQSAWKWYAHLPEAERAFLQMSWRLRLGRRERAVVRRLAAGIGAAPVALLVSETAFRRAMGVIGAEETVVRRAVNRIEGRVFASV